MSDLLAKYERLVLCGRLVGALVILTGGSLFVISEEHSPSLYLAAFGALQGSILSLIVLTIYTSRYKRRHGIHRHG